MYVPSHFSVTEQEEIFSFLNANAFGQLISVADHRHKGLRFKLEIPQIIHFDRSVRLSLDLSVAPMCFSRIACAGAAIPP